MISKKYNYSNIYKLKIFINKNIYKLKIFINKK